MTASAQTFIRAFKAEALKGHRAAPRKIALFMPLPFCLLGLVSSGVLSGNPGASGPGMAGMATFMWNYWAVLPLPIAISLISASIANADARHRLHTILGLPAAPEMTWWAKAAYALVLVLGANLVIVATSCLLHMLGAEGPGLFDGLAIALIFTLTSAWMVPASLFLTQRFNTLVGIALPSLIQLGGGILLWSVSWWFLAPPAACALASAPLLHVAPSGIPLEAGSPLGVFGWQAGVSLIVSAVLFAALAYAGARWFSRQEAQ